MKLKIGKLVLPSNIIVAPIAGFTDVAWRILARKLGAGLVFSEMVSVEGLMRNHRKSLDYLENDERARPFALQLFGSNPLSFSAALRGIAGTAFDLVDINMGCPVRKVVKRGAGSALMKSPEMVAAILKEVRAVYGGPLTVKIRSGWDSKSINTMQIAMIAEDYGVDAVIVHPRTQTQQFKGKSDWKVIAEVKKSVSIPVIGNGDVVDRASAMSMFDETGCDGIMVGRAAVAHPWIFAEIGDEFTVRPKDVFKVIREHIRLLMKFESERCTVYMMRKFIPKYLKGMNGSRTVVSDVSRATSVDKILDSLERFEHLHHDGD